MSIESVRDQPSSITQPSAHAKLLVDQAMIDNRAQNKRDREQKGHRRQGGQNCGSGILYPWNAQFITRSEFIVRCEGSSLTRGGPRFSIDRSSSSTRAQSACTCPARMETNSSEDRFVPAIVPPHACAQCHTVCKNAASPTTAIPPLVIRNLIAIIL